MKLKYLLPTSNILFGNDYIEFHILPVLQDGRVHQVELLIFPEKNIGPVGMEKNITTLIADSK